LDKCLCFWGVSEMHITLLLALSLCAHAYTSCGAGSVMIQNAVISPNPTRPGGSLGVQVAGVASRLVPLGSSLSVSVSYIGVTVYSTTGQLCPQLASGCPAAKDESLLLNIHTALPSAVPSSIRYSLRLKAASTDNEQLFCVDIPFSVVAKQGRQKPAPLQSEVASFTD